MELDRVLTDTAGLTIMAIGLVSLTESLLQVALIGDELPMVQGTIISFFAVSFGGLLMTESASQAFRRLRMKCGEMLRT